LISSVSYFSLKGLSPLLPPRGDGIGLNFLYVVIIDIT